MDTAKNPWWILLQGCAIVASILLAFGIEAWWGEREERSTEQRILLVLDAELQANLRLIEEEISYHTAMREVIAQIYRAAAGDLQLSKAEVDILFADLLWWSEPEFAVGALISLVDGGQLGILDDPEVALQAVRLNESFKKMAQVVERDRATTNETLIPFLIAHGSLPDLSKLQAIRGKPGVGRDLGLPENEIVLSSGRRSHTSVINNEDFLGMLVPKRWAQVDANLAYTKLRERIVELRRMLQAE
jgi:hypothetical protein